MNKWIDERAWKIAVYIVFLLCYIAFSVGGYNYTLRMVGDTNSLMKFVIFVCSCLFVAIVFSLIYSAFLTPISEFLTRLLYRLFPSKTEEMAKTVTDMQITDEGEDGNADGGEKENAEESADKDEDGDRSEGTNDNLLGETNTEETTPPENINESRDDDNDMDISQDEVQVDALKEEFVKQYVRFECRDLPIYEVFASLFDQQKSGAFAARAFKCAMSNPIQWLKCFPGYEDAKKFFPNEDAIKGGKSNYSNANNKKDYSKKTIEETISLLENKLAELTASSKETAG